MAMEVAGMRFQIRECEIGDAKAICELNATELGYVYSVDKTKDKIKELFHRPSEPLLMIILFRNRFFGFYSVFIEGISFLIGVS